MRLQLPILLLILLLSQQLDAQHRIGAVCRDGSISSATGQGACSHHGGVAQWRYSNSSIENRSSINLYQSSSSSSERSRIGAVCMDGTRSYSTGSGTCSNHGGVDYWLHADGSTEEATPSGNSGSTTNRYNSPSSRPIPLGTELINPTNGSTDNSYISTKDLQFIRKYHNCLMYANWDEVSNMYATQVTNYYGNKGYLVGQVLADHKDYHHSYDIKGFEFFPNGIHSASTRSGIKYIYLVDYNIERRSDQKRLGYYLLCELLIDHSGKITGVNSKIIERFSGGTPSNSNHRGRYSINLEARTYSTLRELATTYHDELKVGAIQAVIQRYAMQVEYYTEGIYTHEQIYADHQQYTNKYEILSYHIDPDSWVIYQNGDHYLLTYSMAYTIRRRSDQKVFRYSLANELGVNLNDQIFMVDSKIIERL